MLFGNRLYTKMIYILYIVNYVLTFTLWSSKEKLLYNAFAFLLARIEQTISHHSGILQILIKVERRAEWQYLSLQIKRHVFNKNV